MSLSKIILFFSKDEVYITKLRRVRRREVDEFNGPELHDLAGGSWDSE